MGDYADFSIDRDLDNHIDFHQNKNEDNYMNEWDGEEIPIFKEEKWSVFEFKEIKKETDKAWYLRMSGDALTWFPKSKCKIKDNIILVPNWLCSKIAGWK